MQLRSKLKQKLSCGFWNIGIIKCSAKDLVYGRENYDIVWMKHNSRTKFYADPFPINEDEDNYYILAEEYSYFTRKGIIVELTVDKLSMRLINRKVVLNTGIHLSFPFPYKNTIVPEQYRSGKLYAYKAVEENCICNDPVIDPCILEYHGETYLFGTRIINDASDANTKLFWYKMVNGKFEIIDNEPIKTDIRSARPAGKFFEVDGILYRPAQDSERMYGAQTRIMRVEGIDEKYEETEIRVISTKNLSEYNEGIHTFNAWRNIVVVDGFQTEMRVFLKILFLINRKIHFIR